MCRLYIVVLFVVSFVSGKDQIVHGEKLWQTFGTSYLMHFDTVRIQERFVAEFYPTTVLFAHIRLLLDVHTDMLAQEPI